MDIKRNTPVNGALYLAVALVSAFAAQAGHHRLEMVVKPLMMIILSSWFFFNSRRYGDRFTLMVQAGLFFSLVGDVALMFQHLDEFFFLIGLSAFLLAHICYTIAFIRNISEVGGWDGLLMGGIVALVVMLYGTWFGWELSERLDRNMLIPVLGYVVAIGLMATLAGFRWMRTFARSFWTVLVGAALFMVSDSLLATNRFIRPLEWSPAVITLTYAAAQFLIAGGCLLHVLDPDSIRKRQALEA